MPRTTRNSKSRLSNQQETMSAPSPSATTAAPPSSLITPATNARSSPAAFHFAGTDYDNYQDMVTAKRRRNAEKLGGIVQSVEEWKSAVKKPASSKGIRRTKRPSTDTDASQRRKSSRLQGIEADKAFVEDERGGRITVNGAEGLEGLPQSSEPQFYRGRVNDGEPLSITEAIDACDDRWKGDNSMIKTPKDVAEVFGDHYKNEREVDSESSDADDTLSDDLQPAISTLNVDEGACVAKVCPDRIYSVAFHPTRDAWLVAAGDKQGYIGLWKSLDRENRDADDDDQHCLFRPHRSPTSCLEWTRQGLLSTSYDGTVRFFDVQQQSFQQVFACYDKDEKFQGKPGYGIDTGHQFWVQYGCADPTEQGMYLATSVGDAMHVDFRTGGLTFTRELSERKINSLSIHPDGNTMVSAGLDGCVRSWDIRHLNGEALSTYECGRSINSAFYSSSGQSVVCTTMASRLDVLKSTDMNYATHSLRHDNCTGRWLTTFQAVYHPTIDGLFAVGSMARPRCVELFRADKQLRAVRGDALTAVVSRLAFHPRSDRIALAGGNSSGRVTLVK